MKAPRGNHKVYKHRDYVWAGSNHHIVGTNRYGASYYTQTYLDHYVSQKSGYRKPSGPPGYDWE